MTKQHKDNLFWGIILVFLGGIFLLHNLGIPTWHFIRKLWPLILIFWGASKLYYGIKAKGRAEKSEITVNEVEIIAEDKKDES